jgi:mannose-6-phosphate isomerase-like protein (cupin superfamily)
MTKAKLTELDPFNDKLPPDSRIKTFSYRRPELKRNRAFVPMVRSDVMYAHVQVIRQGGEQELHSHGALDGFWFVLGGRARFYGDGDVLLAELGRHEGIFIPHDALYWFEAVGDEPLELLQVEARDKTLKNTYYTPEPKPVGLADIFTPEGEAIASDVRVE